MNAQEPLDQRVTHLENIVAEQQRTLKQLTEALADQSSRVPVDPVVQPPKPTPEPAPSKPRTHKPTSAEPKTSIPEDESWIGKIGIGLLLFGVAFLFKYSIDQGWLIPPVRVGFGLALGAGLLAIANRVHADRRHFSQLLTGGGIAVFYITGFAAFQLYTLISHPTAFAFMMLITLIGFAQSLRQNEAVLSIIATAGGLGTPFLLYTGTGSLPGLIGYTCLILIGTSAIYFYRGWRSLLWTSVVGGWWVFAIAVQHLPPYAQDRWVLQLGIVFAWLAFGALPVYRETLLARNSTRWPNPSLDFLAEFFSTDVREFATRHVHLLSVSTPLITLGLTATVWNLPSETWGWIVMSGAAIYGVTAWKLKQLAHCKPLAYTHALVALLLFTIAICLLLSGHTLFLTLAAEATVLHLISHRLKDRGTELYAHGLFSILALVIIIHISETPRGTAILNAQALTDLAVIIAAAGISSVLRSPASLIYRLGAHLAILAWFWHELAPLPNGIGYVTIVWGLYAVVLLIIGIRLNLNQLTMIANATLLLVVGKLFLIDLDRVDPIWRILLFLGFGGLFLIISYYFQAIKKPEADKKMPRTNGVS